MSVWGDIRKRAEGKNITQETKSEIQERLEEEEKRKREIENINRIIKTYNLGGNTKYYREYYSDHSDQGCIYDPQYVVWYDTYYK